jgi:hypothetical protein
MQCKACGMRGVIYVVILRFGRGLIKYNLIGPTFYDPSYAQAEVRMMILVPVPVHNLPVPVVDHRRFLVVGGRFGSWVISAIVCKNACYKTYSHAQPRYRAR